MPEILIKSCEHTPNCDALEAVLKFMLKGCRQRRQLDIDVIKVDRGLTLRVEELPYDNATSICSCTFEVTRLDDPLNLKLKPVKNTPQPTEE